MTHPRLIWHNRGGRGKLSASQAREEERLSPRYEKLLDLSLALVFFSLSFLFFCAGIWLLSH
jgi:hypothetical protein